MKIKSKSTNTFGVWHSCQRSMRVFLEELNGPSPASLQAVQNIHLFHARVIFFPSAEYREVPQGASSTSITTRNLHKTPRGGMVLILATTYFQCLWKPALGSRFFSGCCVLCLYILSTVEIVLCPLNVISF